MSYQQLFIDHGMRQQTRRAGDLAGFSLLQSRKRTGARGGLVHEQRMLGINGRNGQENGRKRKERKGKGDDGPANFRVKDLCCKSMALSL